MDASTTLRAFLTLLPGVLPLSVVPVASAQDRLPTPRVALVYSKSYEIDLGGLEKQHAFDIHKYEKIRKALVADGLVASGDFFVPQPIGREEILLVHTEGFLDSLKKPANVAQYLEAPVARLVPGPLLDRGVLAAFRHASGGTILGARLALEHGIAINLGGGYHHAKPQAGEGFSIYADMPIAIRLLQKEKKIGRALVVDLDVHQGNGSAVCLADDETTFTFSMHQRNIYPIPKEKSDLDIELESGTGDEEYMKRLKEALPGVIDRARPDLVFLQAGCDTLQGDPLAGLAMTKDGIVARDAYVIDECMRRRIPLVMTLGGGYSDIAWRVQHASIARSVRAYGLVKPAAQQKPGKKASSWGKLTK